MFLNRTIHFFQHCIHALLCLAFLLIGPLWALTKITINVWKWKATSCDGTSEVTCGAHDHTFPGFEVGTSAQKPARRRVEILSDQSPHCRTAYVKAPKTVATSTAWCILPCTFWHLPLLLLPWGVSLPPVPVTCPIFMTNVTVAGNPHKTMSSDWKTILFPWLSQRTQRSGFVLVVVRPVTTQATVMVSNTYWPQAKMA